VSTELIFKELFNMKKIVITFLTIIAIGVTLGFSQTPSKPEPKLFVDESGQVFIQSDEKAYFFVTPAQRPGELTQIPSGDEDSNPMSFDGNGAHYVSYRDAKSGTNVRYKIMADGVAPVSIIQFQSGILFQYNSIYFVEKGAVANFAVKDNMTGAGESYVSFNGEPFKAISETFSVEKDGESTLKYYSTDKVGNMEEVKEAKIIATTNASVSLENIYFDLNSDKLRSEGVNELNKLAQLLNAYPNVVIELSAHTDTRGEANYNQGLSESRANAAASYLTSKGVSKSRITAKGYGDKKPINECLKGTTCPETKHKQNRRVEIRITKMDGK
jgi:outer membrane protein OmpA-like peptidoglycan-associated protein